jgi:hypothetical protein
MFVAPDSNGAAVYATIAPQNAVAKADVSRAVRMGIMAAPSPA